MSAGSSEGCGRSRMCPTLASTSYPSPRYPAIVRALAGDSTMTSLRPADMRSCFLRTADPWCRACGRRQHATAGAGELYDVGPTRSDPEVADRRSTSSAPDDAAAAATMPSAPPPYDVRSAAVEPTGASDSQVRRSATSAAAPASAVTAASSQAATAVPGPSRRAVRAAPPPRATVRSAAVGGRRSVAVSTPSASTAHASAPQASTTSRPATTSDGRCHWPTSVLTPVAPAYAPPSTAAHGRARGGTTSSTAAATEAAAVVCPLGSVLNSGPSPRSGRSRTQYFR